MNAALAIFVKTPGLSALKTRLAAGIGEARAIAFHRMSAQAVAQVVRETCVGGCGLDPYWAVAEAEALEHDAWTCFARLWQGEGDLAARLHRVYTGLQQRHGRALLIGADAPQISMPLLRVALSALDDPAAPFVLGEACDGGFWLFGGREPVPDHVWHQVQYSHARTAAQLRSALAPLGAIAPLPVLADVDSASDLPALIDALQALPAPVPGQRILLTWLLAQAELAACAEVRA